MALLHSIYGESLALRLAVGEDIWDLIIDLRQRSVRFSSLFDTVFKDPPMVLPISHRPRSDPPRYHISCRSIPIQAIGGCVHYNKFHGA